MRCCQNSTQRGWLPGNDRFCRFLWPVPRLFWGACLATIWAWTRSVTNRVIFCSPGPVLRCCGLPIAHYDYGRRSGSPDTPLMGILLVGFVTGDARTTKTVIKIEVRYLRFFDAAQSHTFCCERMTEMLWQSRASTENASFFAWNVPGLQTNISGYIPVFFFLTFSLQVLLRMMGI
jgi:hypothetical protein